MKHVPTRLAAGLLALALSACSRQAADAAPVAPADAGAEATPVQADDAASPSAPTNAAPAAYDFPLLTRNGEAVSDPRIVSTDQDHPCGPLDTVRVTSIPMDDPVFVPAYVVEFDDQGRELTKWGIPAEAEIVGLDGQRLQFQSRAGRFRVTPQGALEKIDATAPAQDLRSSESMFECPKLPTFAESGAEQCFRVADAAGATRRIAMEGTCS